MKLTKEYKINKEGSLGGVAITSTEAYKELILRSTGNDMVNLPHFFFKHLEWNINDRLQLSVIEDENNKTSLLIENKGK